MFVSKLSYVDLHKTCWPPRVSRKRQAQVRLSYFAFTTASVGGPFTKKGKADDARKNGAGDWRRRAGSDSN